MTEQDASKKPAEQIQSQPKPIEPIRTDEAPVIPKPPPTDEIHNETKEDKPKWTDKTVALFTLFLFLAAVIQGVIFYKQWQEMHSGGEDTHTLALAAKAQADAAKAQADEAKEQVERMAEALNKTDSLIKEATAQAVATKGIAASTQNQEAILKEFLDAEVDKDQASVTVRNPRIVQTDRFRRIPALEVDFFNAGTNSATQIFYTSKRSFAMGPGYVTDGEATASYLKIIGTQYGPKSEWSQTQDISGNGSVPVDFIIQVPRGTSDIDVVQMIVGRIEYDTIFHKPRWKNFCLLVVVTPSTVRGEDWNYTPRFCVAGQEGDKA